MRTQLDDLQAEIRMCEANKKIAITEADIMKWRYWENKEQEARTIMYNIR